MRNKLLASVGKLFSKETLNRFSVYKAAVTAMHEGIIVFDVDGNVLSCNPAAERILGMSLADMQSEHHGFTSWHPFHEDGTPFPVEQLPLSSALTVGTPSYDLVLGNVTPDGRTVWLQVNAEPVKEPHSGIPIALVTTFTDITTLKQSEMALRESEARFHAIFEQALDGIALMELESSRFALANPAFCRMTGYRRDEVGQLSMEELHPKESLPRLRQHLSGRKRRPSGLLPDIPVLCKNGHIVFNDIMTSRLEMNGRHYLLKVFRDATERRNTESQLRQAAIAFEHSQEGVMITDTEANIISINPAFTAITGYREEDVLNQHPRLLRSERHNESFYRAMWEHVNIFGSWSGEIWGRCKDGRLLPTWLDLSAVKDKHGEITHYIGIFVDLTQMKRSEEELEQLTFFDPLTELPNRRMLEIRMSAALNQARRHHQRTAVLLIDADNFKNINDRFGLPVGDSVMQQLAARLQQCAGPEGFTARVAGDSMVLFIEELASVDDASRMAEHIRQSLLEPFRVDHQELFITASIGISVHPENGADAATLLKNAEVAAARAKERGRDCYLFYSEEFSRASGERLAMESGLRQALARDELQLYYQPQIDLQSGRLAGIEALMRWQHPEQGMIPPDRFIPVAEGSGLIVAVGDFALQQACRQMKRWREAGLAPVRVSVNLSARQVAQSKLVEGVADMLSASRVPPDMLELELTESSIMADPELASRVLKRFAKMRIDLAIDDFGTGYSSLAYLQRFHVDRLKIDKAFIENLPGNTADAALCHAIIQMARSLGLQTIAEGVETEEQREFLANAGCDIGQGYLFARPMPAAAFEQWLREYPVNPVAA